MDVLVTALFLSIAANRLVEAFAAPVKAKWPTADLWWLVYVAWGVGGVLSFLAGINLFATIVPSLPSVVGQIITALVVGGGSNLIHDIIDRPPTTSITATSENAGTMTATVSTDTPTLGKSSDRPISPRP